MFIYTFKANKKAIIGVLLVLISLIILCVLIPSQSQNAAALSAASLKAQSNAERIDFIRKFGYDVIEEPVETRDVNIPERFDATYTAYNELQQQQGFDLTKLKGKRVKSYSYAVTNYPDTAQSEKTIRVNLMVFDGSIVAADVCSVALDGFMHALINGTTG